MVLRFGLQFMQDDDQECFGMSEIPVDMPPLGAR